MKKIKIIILLSTSIIIIYFGYKKIRPFINPHYLDNKDVTVDKKVFNPDGAVSVLYYNLDIGARGIANYKTIYRNQDNNIDLLENNLPPQLIVDKWTDNKTLQVIYDPNQAFIEGGGITDLDLGKDTLTRNGILIIIKQRIKENRDSVFNANFGRYK